MNRWAKTCNSWRWSRPWYYWDCAWERWRKRYQLRRRRMSTKSKDHSFVYLSNLMFFFFLALRLTRSASAAIANSVPVIFWLAPFFLRKLRSLGSLSGRGSCGGKTFFVFSRALTASTRLDVCIVNTPTKSSVAAPVNLRCCGVKKF